jgi:hypothetical protein
MKQKFLSIICLLFIFIIILSHGTCSIEKFVVRRAAGFFNEGLSVYMAESDLAVAELAMPANLKLLETLLAKDPDNPEILIYASQAYLGYTMAFVEDKGLDFEFTDEKLYRKSMKRAKKFYLRGRNYGIKAVILKNDNKDPYKLSLAEYKKWLQTLDKEWVPYIFWTSLSWGSAINVDRDDLELFSKMAYIVASMERVIQLDEYYFVGGAHLFLGMYYGGLPGLYGNKKDISLKHFNRLNQLTKNRHLLSKVFQAEFLSVQYQDKPMFDKLLKEVTESPEDLWPEMGLINSLAKKKAIRLKANENEYF